MSSSPPIAPAPGGSIYFVLCDNGPKNGRAYTETDPDQADRETVISLLMSGAYSGPVQVLEVDLAAGRASDVSAEFAADILQRTGMDDLPLDVAMFVSVRASLGVHRL